MGSGEDGEKGLGLLCQRTGVNLSRVSFFKS